MSKINIEGIVRDIKGRTTYLTPIIEAICNSIDAIGDNIDGKVEIVVKRDGQTSFNNDDSRNKGNIIAIDVIDNGVGFNTDNRESFDTFRSGYKYSSGGKGFGRFMYLKYFSHVSIESTFLNQEKEMRFRKFTLGHGEEIIVDEVESDSEKSSTGTILHLNSIKSNTYIDKGLEVIARKLVERLLVFFVDKSKHIPQIVLREEDENEKIVLNNYVGPSKDIQEIGDDTITVLGNERQSSVTFSVKSYKIYFSDLTSKISLTAHSREVTETPIHSYIPEFKDTLFEIDEKGKQKNYSVKTYVIGDYLDNSVNVQRDGFEINTENDNFWTDISIEAILKEAASFTKTLFSEEMERRYTAKKIKVIKYVNEVAPWHKTTLKYLDLENMPVGISEAELEMRLQKVKFDKEQSTRITIKEMLNNQDLAEENELSLQVEEIMKSISETGKNDLVHYICTRKKVIDIFDNLRRRTDSGKPHLEKELHNLIFPMVSDDQKTDYKDHNLWLLDERLVFSEYVASDRVISKADHDEPDLAVFYKERLFFRNGENIITSPISIFEFKRPKRNAYQDEDNPILQACRYAKKILEGQYELPDGIERVKVSKDSTPVYIYIVCDIVPKINDFAQMSNLTISPDGEGYFGYIQAFNAYVEIMSFRKLIEDAKMRNRIFFKKLGLE